VVRQNARVLVVEKFTLGINKVLLRFVEQYCMVGRFDFREAVVLRVQQDIIEAGREFTRQ